MTATTIRRALLLMLGSGAVTLAACDPPAGPAATAQAPPAGLTILADRYRIDQWGKRVPQSETPNWITAIGDTASYFGRDNVARFVTRNDTNASRPGDTSYLFYDKSGDIALYERFTGTRTRLGHGRWVPFPVGLKGTKSAIALDTAFTYGSYNYAYRETWTWSFLGPEAGSVSFGIASTALKAQIVQEVTKADGFDVPVSTVRSIWYSPAIGAIVRLEELTTERTPTGTKEVGGYGWDATHIKSP